jgi:hypothetical protein
MLPPPGMENFPESTFSLPGFSVPVLSASGFVAKPPPPPPPMVKKSQALPNGNSILGLESYDDDEQNLNIEEDVTVNQKKRLITDDVTNIELNKTAAIHTNNVLNHTVNTIQEMHTKKKFKVNPTAAVKYPSMNASRLGAN